MYHASTPYSSRAPLGVSLAMGLIHMFNQHVWGYFHQHFHMKVYEPMRQSLGLSTIWFRVGTLYGASAQKTMLDSTETLGGCGENGARYQF